MYPWVFHFSRSFLFGLSYVLSVFLFSISFGFLLDFLVLFVLFSPIRCGLLCVFNILQKWFSDFGDDLLHTYSASGTLRCLLKYELEFYLRSFPGLLQRLIRASVLLCPPITGTIVIFGDSGIIRVHCFRNVAYPC